MFIRFHWLVALALTFAACTAFAATPAAVSKPRTAQQQRMAECSKQSKGTHGDARKAAMSACLRGHGKAAASAQGPASGAGSTASAKTAARTSASARSGALAKQNRKTCNADAKAKALKGDARKSFVSACVKGAAH